MIFFTGQYFWRWPQVRPDPSKALKGLQRRTSGELLKQNIFTGRMSKIFVPPQTPFPGAQGGQNLISWRWSLPLPTNPVWWGLMHAISSYLVIDTHTHTQTHRQDRLQYTVPLSLARSVTVSPNIKLTVYSQRVRKRDTEKNTQRHTAMRVSSTRREFHLSFRRSMTTTNPRSLSCRLHCIHMHTQHNEHLQLRELRYQQLHLCIYERLSGLLLSLLCCPFCRLLLSASVHRLFTT